MTKPKKTAASRRFCLRERRDVRVFSGCPEIAIFGYPEIARKSEKILRKGRVLICHTKNKGATAFFSIFLGKYLLFFLPELHRREKVFPFFFNIDYANQTPSTGGARHFIARRDDGSDAAAVVNDSPHLFDRKRIFGACTLLNTAAVLS